MAWDAVKGEWAVWIGWGLFLAGWLILWRFIVSLRNLIASRLDRSRAGPVWRAAHILIAKTSTLLVGVLVFLGLSFAVSLPFLSPAWLEVRSKVAVVAVILQIGIWGSSLLRLLFSTLLTAKGGDSETSSALSLLTFLGQILCWGLVLLLILENLGVDVTALVAGLGVGGVAVALAVQNILGDLFASLSIVLDKPFEVGDFIVAGEMSGTVERIGIKTTRVRSVSGEQIVFSNSDLLSARIRNFKRMYERRVLFTLGVVYQTPLETLREIPSIVRGFIEAEECTRFDRAHLKEPGNSAYLFEFVYFVKDREFGVYMDTHQRILFKIIEEFTKRKIEFAYPTQTVFIEANAVPDSRV